MTHTQNLHTKFDQVSCKFLQQILMHVLVQTCAE